MRILGVLIAIYIIMVVSPVNGADPVWGVWADSGGENTYAFLKNNEFIYRGPLGAYSKETYRFEFSTKKVEGLWQHGEKICWSGEQKANLIIYVDTLRCCMLAQFIGNKLVLSKIWADGFENVNICNNRVLTRIKEMPKD